MRQLGLTVIAFVLAAGGSLPSAQSRATATNVPVIPHEAVPNFFKNPPGIYTGENMGTDEIIGIDDATGKKVWGYNKNSASRVVPAVPKATMSPVTITFGLVRTLLPYSSNGSK